MPKEDMDVLSSSVEVVLSLADQFVLQEAVDDVMDETMWCACNVVDEAMVEVTGKDMDEVMDTDMDEVLDKALDEVMDKALDENMANGDEASIFIFR